MLKKTNKQNEFHKYVYNIGLDLKRKINRNT